MWLFYVYLLLTGESPTNGGGVTIVGTVASAFLGLMLVFNAIMALISYIENRKTELSHHYRRNFILAAIPPIFVITILVILFFYRLLCFLID